MPSYDNQIVYRGISDPDNLKSFFNSYISMIGKEITEHAFMSAHIENERWFDIQFIIKTKQYSNGKNLGNISPIEHEVLFKTNTKLKIDTVDRDNKIINLIEV